MLRVVFFGSSDYCLPVLEALHKNFDLKLVVTRPDKPVGRKQILAPSPTKAWAKTHHVPVAKCLNINCDLALVADFGRIISEEEFNRPKLGTFNIHFSKLPDLRGASPVQACLLRGDTTAWITIFKIEKTLDTGPILWQKDYPIAPDDTAETLRIRLFREVARQLPKINFSGPLAPQEGNPTFCKKLSRDDGFVEWKDVENPKIYNKFRAYYPWPGLWTIHPNGKRVKILKCHLEGEKLILDQIQFAGEKPQPFSDKLRL